MLVNSWITHKNIVFVYLPDICCGSTSHRRFSTCGVLRILRVDDAEAVGEEVNDLTDELMFLQSE